MGETKSRRSGSVRRARRASVTRLEWSAVCEAAAQQLSFGWTQRGVTGVIIGGSRRRGRDCWNPEKPLRLEPPYAAVWLTPGPSIYMLSATRKSRLNTFFYMSGNDGELLPCLVPKHTFLAPKMKLIHHVGSHVEFKAHLNSQKMNSSPCLQLSLNTYQILWCVETSILLNHYFSLTKSRIHIITQSRISYVLSCIHAGD